MGESIENRWSAAPRPASWRDLGLRSSRMQGPSRNSAPQIFSTNSYTRSSSDSVNQPSPPLLQPRVDAAMTALRTLSPLPYLQHTSRFAPLRTSLPICISCASRAFGTGSTTRALKASTPTAIQSPQQRHGIWRAFSTGLLCNLDRRPGLEMVGHEGKSELFWPLLLLSSRRGMKVRSSVKKLCEGCKVWFFFSFFV